MINIIKSNFDIANINHAEKQDISNLNLSENQFIVLNDSNLMGYLPFLKKIQDINKKKDLDIKPVISLAIDDKNYYAIDESGLKNLILFKNSGDIDLLNNSGIVTDINEDVLNNNLKKYSFLDDFKLGGFMPIYQNSDIEKEKLLNPDNLYSFLEEKITQLLTVQNKLELKDVYIDRVKKELDVFNRGNALNEDLIPYILVVKDIVNLAKENNIAVGPGRGSGAGCLTAYLLEITDCDPIEYDLSFERFLNANRANFPDFDIDFDSRKLTDLKTLIENELNYKVLSMRTFMSASKIDIRLSLDKLIENSSEEFKNLYIDVKTKIMADLDEDDEWILENLNDYLNDTFSKIYTKFKMNNNEELKEQILRMSKIKAEFSNFYNSGKKINDILNESFIKYPDEFSTRFLNGIKSEFLKLKTPEAINDFKLNANKYIENIFDITIKKEITTNMSLPVDMSNEIKGIVGAFSNYKATSIHASGNIIIHNDQLKEIEKIIQIDKEKDKDGKEILIASTPPSIVENIGLLKFDLLALKTLSLLEVTKESAKNKIITTIDRNDKNVEKTLNMLIKNENGSLFQLNSPEMELAVKKIALKLKNNPEINIIEELANAIAFVRPGPMQNGSTLKYVNNENEDLMNGYKKTGVKMNEFENQLKNILTKTQGQIVYQEQVMKIAELAGMSPIESDNFRRAISKKDIVKINEQKENFMIKCMNLVEDNADNNKYVEKLFDNLASFAEYGFNKSHSICYAKLLWETAYSKSCEPEAYICSFIKTYSGEEKNSTKNPKYITQGLIEAGEMKIPVLPYFYNLENYNKDDAKQNIETKLLDNKIILGSKVFTQKRKADFNIVDKVNVLEEIEKNSIPLTFAYNIGKAIGESKEKGGNIVHFKYANSNSFPYSNFKSGDTIKFYSHLKFATQKQINGKDVTNVSLSDISQRGQSKNIKYTNLSAWKKIDNLPKSGDMIEVSVKISKGNNEKVYYNFDSCRKIVEVPSIVSNTIQKQEKINRIAKSSREDSLLSL